MNDLKVQLFGAAIEAFGLAIIGGVLSGAFLANEHILIGAFMAASSMISMNNAVVRFRMFRQR